MSIEKPVVFKSAGEQVVGMLHLPRKSKGKHPAVVCFHGFTGNKQESHRLFVKVARMLAAAGQVCLRIDFRGSGDSEGDFSQMTPSGELLDAVNALKFLRGRPEVNPKRIGVLGMSMGGMITSLLLEKDKGIKTAVLWSPVGNPRRLVEVRMNEQTRHQLDTMGIIDNGGWAVGKEFIGEMMALNPLKAVVKAKGPILIIHGDRDEAVPMSETYAYIDALKAAKKTVDYRIVAGADHVYSSLAWEAQVLGLTLAWFSSKL
jgi:dipeptidyl aminopeptidase/acylaminoacyl peptidase